jgi:ubiquinol-cytochrome c reductase cytochrome b subunit
MPLYPLGKSKPLPGRLTSVPSLEERFAVLVEIFNTMTIMKPVQTVDGTTVLKRRPNPKGILDVITRLAIKLKKSLD